MQFIDTHTHIYDEAFAGEEDAVILRAREAGVSVMLQPDVDSRERDAMFALVDRHPGELYAMLARTGATRSTPCSATATARSWLSVR